MCRIYSGKLFDSKSRATNLAGSLKPSSQYSPYDAWLKVNVWNRRMRDDLLTD